MSTLVLPALPGRRLDLRRVAEHAIEIQQAESGKEYRTRRRLQPIRRWSLSYRVRNTATFAEIQALAGHVSRHGGQADDFLVVDPADHDVTDHGFGIGNGTATQFQLQRALLGFATDSLGSTWVPATKRRTNALLYSQDLSQSAWAKMTGVICTAAKAMAPDGTVTASRIVYNGTGSSGGNRVYQQAGTPGSGALWCNSIWLRADSPVTLRLGDSFGHLVVCALATSWQRFSVGPTTCDGSTPWQILINSAAGDNASWTVYAWGAQAEAGAAPTRYIPTTSAAANADPTYWPGLGDGFEPVYEPDWGSASIFKAGVLQTPVSPADYSVAAKGVVSFTTAPASGAQLSWSGNFWRRVRFDGDVELARIVDALWSGERVGLVEVLP